MECVKVDLKIVNKLRTGSRYPAFQKDDTFLLSLRSNHFPGPFQKLFIYLLRRAQGTYLKQLDLKLANPNQVRAGGTWPLA